MKNKLTDLNNHLFAQLERLSDEEIDGEKLEQEIQRARAVKEIAQQIVATANTALRGQEFIAEYQGGKNVSVPKMIEE